MREALEAKHRAGGPLASVYKPCVYVRAPYHRWVVVSCGVPGADDDTEASLSSPLRRLKEKARAAPLAASEAALSRARGLQAKVCLLKPRFVRLWRLPHSFSGLRMVQLLTHHEPTPWQQKPSDSPQSWTVSHSVVVIG